MEAPVLLITFLRPDSTLKILNIIKKIILKTYLYLVTVREKILMIFCK